MGDRLIPGGADFDESELPTLEEVAGDLGTTEQDLEDMFDEDGVLDV